MSVVQTVRHRLTTILAMLLGVHTVSSAFAQSGKLPDGAGKETMQRVCSACHGAEIVVGRKETAEGWQGIVANMAERGAQASDEEFGEIIQYLTTNFSNTAAPAAGSAAASTASAGSSVNVNKATAKELEAGLDLTAKDAGAIIQRRTEKGNFKTIDELKQIPGISTDKIEAKKAQIVF